MRLKPWARTALVMILFAGAMCAGYRQLPYRLREKTFFDGPFDEMRFDRALWISKAPWKEDGLYGADQPLRGMMLDDLLTNHLRAGMTREEVRAMLGPANGSSKFGVPREWSYGLGAWSGMRMDGDYLSVVFDARGRVERFWAWQS